VQNGIVTTTEAEDETLREAIVSHVSMMVTRLQEGRNPEVIIQSPTLDALSRARHSSHRYPQNAPVVPVVFTARTFLGI
jgi:hypothetical protein